MIHLLAKETIDQIAAGEVVERPSSVVKELVENAVDAGAKGITVEIREGGISLIRVTDDGHGLSREDVRPAFMRHATSKISDAGDLASIQSLGFRGEALSSIAAVSRMELITKTEEELTGIRYCLEGGNELSFQEVGAPEGSTFIVRELFFNVPARRKFLKSMNTESSYIGDIMEKLALSRTDIAFHFIRDKKSVLATTGNNRLLDVIYQIFGKETASKLLPVSFCREGISVSGYVGAPSLSRKNRGTEIYFLNRRYIKDQIISRAIEEGYGTKLMQHQFPFCVLEIAMDPSQIDCNVHPGKMEVRFANPSLVSGVLREAVYAALEKEEIESVSLEAIVRKTVMAADKAVEKETDKAPEKTTNVMEEIIEKPVERITRSGEQRIILPEPFEKNRYDREKSSLTQKIREEIAEKDVPGEYVQSRFLKEEEISPHRLIGQVFLTYWLIEYKGELYIIDQHAAHEKVLYEKLMRDLAGKQVFSQNIAPPIMLHLSEGEAGALLSHREMLISLGFEIEPFGGREYRVNAVPSSFPSVSKEALLRDLLADLVSEKIPKTPERLAAKIASLSCKAAIKANKPITFPEADRLIRDMLSLADPYHCPHGRPTVIRISKTEMEKTFKRIL